ncbi:hypothetical protein Vi05172_g12058 [Venturia inaequalis]|nr:hypothetical protein Vi05172_g12058 [Venturia inaequalis]
MPSSFPFGSYERCESDTDRSIDPMAVRFRHYTGLRASPWS